LRFFPFVQIANWHKAPPALEGLAEAVNGLLLERARHASVWSDHSEYHWLAIAASKHDHEP
jgi:hypothetical protein